MSYQLIPTDVGTARTSLTARGGLAVITGGRVELQTDMELIEPAQVRARGCAGQIFEPVENVEPLRAVKLV
jgi:hypothetical protein